MSRLKQLWNDLRSGLWFVPTLVVLGACLLAVSLIEAETYFDLRRTYTDWPRLFGAGADGARGMLSAIAGSMITVAGVIFSITIVALSLASSQYTPRILRNFMRSRVNQTVLGVFVGVFIYCLIVLRTIRGGDEGSFVPHLAVLFAVALAFVAVGFLIFFIHHIATSIQASSIIAGAAEETLAAIDRLFPEEMGEEPDQSETVKQTHDLRGDLNWQAVPAAGTGYVQNVDAEALLRFARERDAVIKMERGVGEFVVEGAPLVSMAVGGAPDAEAIEGINEIYTISRFRIVEQDAGFGVRQIVDIALKALSPGVNDTTTAVTCVDYLTAIIARLARRRIESRLRYADGGLRLIARGATFESLLDEAFDQIRQNAGANVAVQSRLLHGLEVIGKSTDSLRRREALRRHVGLIDELARRTVEAPHDLAGIETLAARVRDSLNDRRKTYSVELTRQS